MKEVDVKGLIACPLCGGKPVLRCNASKLFQIKCKQCSAHTSWSRKTDAIITWYNMVYQYMRNTGMIQESKQNEPHT